MKNKSSYMYEFQITLIIHQVKIFKVQPFCLNFNDILFQTLCQDLTLNSIYLKNLKSEYIFSIVVIYSRSKFYSPIDRNVVHLMLCPAEWSGNQTMKILTLHFEDYQFPICLISFLFIFDFPILILELYHYSYWNSIKLNLRQEVSH